MSAVARLEKGGQMRSMSRARGETQDQMDFDKAGVAKCSEMWLVLGARQMKALETGGAEMKIRLDAMRCQESRCQVESRRYGGSEAS